MGTDDTDKMSPEASTLRRRLFHLCLSVLIGDCLLLSGCKTTDAPSDARKTQDAALKDPFAYGPDAKSMQKGAKAEDVDPTDITGGGTGELNKKALKRDWDAVWGK